jgi:ADP-heptose:LPS heptosyltransferase
MEQNEVFSSSIVGPPATLHDSSCILFFFPYGIGDVLMHLRSLRSLRSCAKCAVIHGVGSEPAVQLLDDSDLVESIERYDRWGIRHLWDLGCSHTRREFREWFEQKHFDAIVNLTLAPPVIT